MRSKKLKIKQKVSNTKITLLSLIFIVLLVVIGFALKEESVRTSHIQTKYTENVKKFNSLDFQNLNIEEHIYYILPDSWNDMEKTVGSYDRSYTGRAEHYAHYINLTPKNHPNTEKTESIRLHIEVRDNVLNEERFYKNKVENTISGIQGVKGHYDDSNQGHFLGYFFRRNDLFWHIWIQTKDLDSEKMRQEEIDYFINSIKIN